MAVLGSFTAGEMAFKAMSTICSTPNSTSCCKVRDGPRSKAPRKSSLFSGTSRSPLGDLRLEQDQAEALPGRMTAVACSRGQHEEVGRGELAGELAVG